MKTRKHNLSAIAMGVALAMGSLTAQAGSPLDSSPVASGVMGILDGEDRTTAPSFNRNEQVGLCLIESVVSLLASRTNDFSCDAKTYDLSVISSAPGIATATIDDGVNLGGTTLEGHLGVKKDIGTACFVDEAAGTNLLGGVPVVNYQGEHGWSRTNEIFNSNALITLKDPQTLSDNFYKEVDIKDFFKLVIDQKSWEFDWGLEDIKKSRSTPSNFYYPVQKWIELSWYNHENGGPGTLGVKKFQVIPRSARGCVISVHSDDLFNGSGEFEMIGTVKVKRIYDYKRPEMVTAE